MTARIRPALALALLAFATAAPAADLAEVYGMAARNDPRLREAEANYRAAREAKPQAWAQYLPQITASVTEQTRKSDGLGSFFDTNTSQYVILPFDSENDSTNKTLTLRQTIFSWAKIKDIQSGAATAAQAEAEFNAARQEAIVRTADRYFGQLAAADGLEAASLNREAIGRQLEQAKKRFEVGLIAVTDVQESQAAYDAAVADEIAAQRSYESAREALREITGAYIADLARPGEGMPLVDPQPASPEDWVKLANEQNLTLVASRFAAESAAHAVGAAWGSHLPTLDLVATENRYEETQTVSINNGVPDITDSESPSNTVALQLNVPIYAGGATQSGVRQAKYRSRAADERLERVTRETQRQARDALLGVTSEISRTKALRQAAESSATALRATEAGFEVGTRTTVDVLESRRNLLRAQVNYRRAKYDYLLNTLRLKQAAGTLADADVGQINTWMNAAAPAQQ
jgi:outer membrane protein